MVFARRAAAVFLTSLGVTGLFFGPRSCRILPSLPPGSSCESRLWLEPWAWLFAGSLLLVAAVLWSAPWRRLRNEPTRTRRLWIRVQVKQRLYRIGGWLLLGLGGAVIFYSVAGLFRSAPDCSWEIGCYEFEFYLGGAFREEAFSLTRVVGVLFGVSLLWWGLLELQLNVERMARVALLGLGFGFLAVVVADPLGYGFTGFGTVQSMGIVIVLSLMAVIVLIRARILGLRELLGPSRGHRRDFLLAAMSVSIILGAWVTVLALIEPMCSGLVRCEHALRPASVLAASIAAAGLYLAFARWQAAAWPLRKSSPHLVDPTYTTYDRL